MTALTGTSFDSDAPPLHVSGSHADLSWNISFDPATRILTASLEGRVTLESLLSFTRFSQAQAGIHKPGGILADYRSTELGLSFTDIYGLPDGAPDFGIAQVFPVAVVGTEAMMGTGEFAENVFSNRGFTYRVFADADDAMTWLVANAANGTNRWEPAED